MIPGILISLLFICIIFLSLNIYIISSATINLNTQTVRIAIYFFRICLFEKYYDLNNDVIKNEDALHSDIFKKLYKHLTERIIDVNDLTSYVLNRFKFKRISWHTNIGTGDAQTTGIAGGGLWAVKGAIISTLSNKSNVLCRPSVNVKPYFNEMRMNSVMNCMVTIRLGQAIRVMFKISHKLNVNRKTTI